MLLLVAFGVLTVCPSPGMLERLNPFKKIWAFFPSGGGEPAAAPTPSYSAPWSPPPMASAPPPYEPPTVAWAPPATPTGSPPSPPPPSGGGCGDSDCSGYTEWVDPGYRDWTSDSGIGVGDSGDGDGGG